MLEFHLGRVILFRKEVGRVPARSDSVDRSRHASARRSAGLATRAQLGLWPERWLRTGARDRLDPGPYG